MRRIDKISAHSFLDVNHRLKSCTGRYYYGLFVRRRTGSEEFSLSEGTLVAIAVFSNARRWNKGEKIISSYEWIRYASLRGVRVVGGMGKLLQFFVDEICPDDIMSYSEASSLDGGEVYEKLGFIKEAIVEKENYKNIKFRLKLTDY